MPADTSKMTINELRSLLAKRDIAIPKGKVTKSDLLKLLDRTNKKIKKDEEIESSDEESEEEEMEYSSMTEAQLKKLLKEKKISFSPTDKKSKLVKLLEKSDEIEESEDEESEEEENENKNPYMSKTVKELTSLAKERGLSRPAGINKEGLAKLLLDDDASPSKKDDDEDEDDDEEVDIEDEDEAVVRIPWATVVLAMKSVFGDDKKKLDDVHNIAFGKQVPFDEISEDDYKLYLIHSKEDLETAELAKKTKLDIKKVKAILANVSALRTKFPTGEKSKTKTKK